MVFAGISEQLIGVGWQVWCWSPGMLVISDGHIRQWMRARMLHECIRPPITLMRSSFSNFYRSSGVGNFRFDPRFHSTDVGWNLGLKWKLPTPGSCIYSGQHRCSECSIYLVKWCRSKQICVLHRKCLRYLHKTYATVFTIPSDITRAKFHISNTIICIVSSFGYVIYSPADAHSPSSVCQLKNN